MSLAICQLLVSEMCCENLCFKLTAPASVYETINILKCSRCHFRTSLPCPDWFGESILPVDHSLWMQRCQWQRNIGRGNLFWFSFKILLSFLLSLSLSLQLPNHTYSTFESYLQHLLKKPKMYCGKEEENGCNPAGLSCRHGLLVPAGHRPHQEREGGDGALPLLLQGHQRHLWEGPPQQQERRWTSFFISLDVIYDVGGTISSLPAVHCLSLSRHTWRLQFETRPLIGCWDPGPLLSLGNVI